MQFKQHTEAQKAIHGEYKQFVDDYQSKHTPYCLTVSGNPGCGKTMLAQSAYWHLRENVPTYDDHRGITFHYRYYFCTWADLADLLREFRYGEWKEAADAHMLVVDDVGATHMTDMTRGKLVQLMDKRLGKWTIYTTNLTLQELDQVDPRISSRLIRNENKFFRSTCPDYWRMAKA